MGLYGGSTGSGDASRKARIADETRANAVSGGIARIDALFNGTKGAGRATTYQPGVTYYNADGTPFNPGLKPAHWKATPKSYNVKNVATGFISGGAGSLIHEKGAKNKVLGLISGGAGGLFSRDNGGPEGKSFSQDDYYAAMAQEAIARGELYAGTENSGGFDDAFYNQRATDYMQFAMPQFTDQTAKARNTLSANLARRGLLNSTAAIKGAGDLNKQVGIGERSIADAARNESNKLRGQVADQRTTLVNQVIAGADPATVGAGAQMAAANLRQPTGFAPLGNLFSDWSTAYAQNQQNRAVNPNVQPLFSFGQPQSQTSSERIIE